MSQPVSPKQEKIVDAVQHTGAYWAYLGIICSPLGCCHVLDVQDRVELLVQFGCWAVVLAEQLN